MTNNKISLPYIGAVILMDGSHHWINQKTFEQIAHAEKDEFIQPDPSKLTMFRVSSISQMLTIEEYRVQYPKRVGLNYGQPFSNQKQLFGQRSTKTLSESMEQYIKKHPQNKAVKKFYEQFKIWKKSR